MILICEYQHFKLNISRYYMKLMNYKLKQINIVIYATKITLNYIKNKYISE